MFNFRCTKFCLNIFLQEKRDLIVEELVSTEQLYVETLHMLVEVSTNIWYLLSLSHQTKIFNFCF